MHVHRLFYAVLYPLKASALCTARRARIITLGLLALAALYNSPRWFELRFVRSFVNVTETIVPGTTASAALTATAAVGGQANLVASNPNITGGADLFAANDSTQASVAVRIEERCETVEAEFLKNRFYVLMYYSWLYTVFKGLLPISLLAVLNALLVVRVRRSCRIRKRFTFTAGERGSLTNAGGGAAGHNVSLAASALILNTNAHSVLRHHPLSLRLSGPKSAHPLIVLPGPSSSPGVRFTTPGPLASKKPSASSTTSTELESTTRSSRKRRSKDFSPTTGSLRRTSLAGKANGNGGKRNSSLGDVKCDPSSGSFVQRIRPPAMNMNYSVTLMLAAIVAVFVVCQLPCVVYNFALAMDWNYVKNDFGWQMLSLLRNFTGTLQSAVNFILFCVLGKHFRALLMKRFPLLRSVYEMLESCVAAADVSRHYRTRDHETNTGPARVAGSQSGPGFNPRSSLENPVQQSPSPMSLTAHCCTHQHSVFLAPSPCACCEHPMGALFVESRGGGAVTAVGDGRMSRSCIDVSAMHHCVVYYRSPSSSPFPSTSGPNC